MTDYETYIDKSGSLIPGKAKVKYLQQDERSNYELYYDGSVLHQGDPEQETDVPFTTSSFQSPFSGAGWGMYVMDSAGHMYVSGHKVGLFHHSSFLAGGDVAAAGELKVSNSGKLEHITNKTGHYKAGPEQLGQAIEELASMGISPDSYNVSVLTLKPGAEHAKVERQDENVLASEWYQRYRHSMTGV
jgi:hypothetical protein